MITLDPVHKSLLIVTFSPTRIPSEKYVELFNFKKKRLNLV